MESLALPDGDVFEDRGALIAVAVFQGARDLFGCAWPSESCGDSVVE